MTRTDPRKENHMTTESTTTIEAMQAEMARMAEARARAEGEGADWQRGLAVGLQIALHASLKMRERGYAEGVEAAAARAARLDAPTLAIVAAILDGVVRAPSRRIVERDDKGAIVALHDEPA